MTDPNNGLYYHLKWWHMASGLAGGKVYRLHIATTDPSSANDQKNTNARNGFTIWADASGGTPSVYGNGAMETFEPLRGGGSEVFYLAQIDKNYAGKTMEINLWDPGDTGNLSASLKVLAPNPGSYVSVPFNWTAHKGTTNANASNCNSLSGHQPDVDHHQHGWQLALQWLLGDHRHPPADQLHGSPTGG